MQSIAFTIVQNDMVGLRVWLRYYSKYFTKVMVITDHTKEMYDSKLAEFTKEYGAEFRRENGIIRDPMETAYSLMSIQQELLKSYDWVLYCNCDEIIATDPKHYKDLKSLMRRCKRKYVVCEGWDVVKKSHEYPLNYDEPILQQRSRMIKNTNYNKVLLSRIPLDWDAGCHQYKKIPKEEYPKFKDTGLHLLHLKYADPDAPTPRDVGPWTWSYGAPGSDNGEDVSIKSRVGDVLV